MLFMPRFGAPCNARVLLKPEALPIVRASFFFAIETFRIPGRP
jgi:hypothetical protein